MLSLSQIKLIAIILLVVIVIDYVLSFNILSKIKNQVKKGRIDNTETVKKQIVKWIQKNTYFYRRIHDSFPKFQIYVVKQKEKIKKYKIKGKKNGNS